MPGWKFTLYFPRYVKLGEGLGCRHGNAELTVNEAAPGFIQTDLIASISLKVLDHIIGGVALPQFGLVEEVADAVYFFLHQDTSGPQRCAWTVVLIADPISRSHLADGTK